ncbi:MAG: OmpA family protein [Lautropia mirabilis]|nr:OmpA family protein [Lautropia mirabilis]
MPSPSPLHPPESVRRFTSLKVGVLLLFVLLLTLFGVQEGEGEGDAKPEAQQQLASTSGNTHTESIELPLGRQAAQAAGSAQGQEGQGAARQANAQGAGPSDDRRAAPVSKDNAPQDKAAASSAGTAGTNGTPADVMADSQAGPAVPAGESVMAPEDDDQPHQPATGDAMIELPGPPSFSLTHDPAGGIRLAGEVPDDDTRNQWMNAIRLGARGESVEGSLRLRHIDGHAAARWEPQLTALVALVRERNISELRVRGDVVEVFGGAQTPAQGRETLELIRAQVPNGYRVLARDEAGAAGATRLAAAGAAAQGAQRLADANRPAGRDARAQAEAQKAADARNAATKARDARNSRDSRNARDTRQAAADSRNLRTAAAGNCPRSLKQLSAPIFFKSGSSSLSPAETRRLQQLGACLGRTAWVRVTGYADPRYSAAYNKTLSERRARAVAGAISEGGFSSARITVVGAGKTSPRTKVRADKATLQRARRVDILVG